MPTKDEMVATMAANLEEKTGKPMAHWVAVAKACGEEKHGGILKHLKTEHGLTHGYANLVAQLARADSPVHESEDGLLKAQYAGPKAGLKPIYEQIIKLAASFGPGLEVAPKKTYVSLRHKKQFALVQPSTKTRLDLGLNLKGVEPKGRLEASGSFNSMVSHRVQLASIDQVDADVARWLKQAFDAAG
jgi:hypothetical protein